MKPEWFIEEEPEKPEEISTQNYSSLEKAEPISTPEKSRPEWSTPDAQKENTLNKVKDVLDVLPADQQEYETAKIQTSMWLADRFEMKPSTVYRNFDTISREFWGKTTQPQGALNSIKQSWILGQKETELGNLRYRQMMGEDVTEQIEELKKSMPAEDQKKRMLPVGMVKSLTRMLPTMLQGMTEGAQRGIALGTGAAGAAALAGQAGPQALTLEEVATVPGAFTAMFGVGSISGSTESIGRIEAGLAYDELLSLGVSEGVAKAAAAGVGSINAALEMMQIKRIPGMTSLARTAMGKTFTKVFKDGTVAGIAKNAISKYGKNVSEQVLQEVMQETTNVMVAEFAKQIENTYKGKDIPYAKIEEITSRLGETAIEAAKGFSLMGVPGTIAETVATGKAKSSRNMTEVEMKEELWNKLANAEGKELDELVEAINEQTGENKKSETTIDIQPGTAKIKSGEKEAEINYSVDDDVITVDSFADLTAYEAREVLATMQNQYPDRVMQFSEEIENVEQLKRGLEDLDPKVRALNTQMDKVSDTLEGLRSEVEEAQGELQTKKVELSQAKESNAAQEEIASIELDVEGIQNQIESVNFSIQSMQDTFTTLQETKNNYNPLEYRESWSMTSGEYRRHLQARNVQESNITTSTTGTALKSEIRRNIPNLKEEEADASVRLVEALAAAKGKNIDEYVDETFRFATEEEKQKVDKAAKAKDVSWSGAHQIGEDGRSIIAASESADFSTFIHELGHVLRRTLTPEEESVVAEWAGAVENEDGTYTWNEAAEEIFADGFTEYLRSGKAPTQDLENIFRKIANFLKEIAGRVFRDVQLSPEVEEVFSEILGAEREQVLFQPSPEAEQAFNDVVAERGLTDDIMEAGYVLPDGRMVDLTGRNEAVDYKKEGDYYVAEDDDYLAGERVEDHRVVDWEGAPYDGLDRMLKFIEYGAMRIDAAAGLINLAHKPTAAQRSAITEIAEMHPDNVTVEIETPAGEYSFYSEASPKKLIGTINRYFNTNERPVEQGEVLFQTAPPTDSEAFKQWFGDSKVVDNKENPKVVYHGSSDVRGILSGEGFRSQLREGQFFFTDDYNVANSYADDRRAFDYQNAEPQVVPVYLSIENPMIIDVKGQSWRKTEERVQEAKEKGHDGIIARNSRDEYNTDGGGRLSTVYIAFKPTQIKSAMTDNLRSRIDGIDLGGGPNRGTFDPNNPNILFQVGPVYHGTPHSFDRFSTKEIGTGEGVQAFGWGLYFTDREDIARHYANAIQDSNKISKINSRLKEISKELEKYRTGEYGKFSDPKGYELKAEYDQLMEEKLTPSRNLYTATLNKGKNLSEYTWIDWDEKIPQTKIDKIQRQNKKEELALDERGWPTDLDIKEGESGSSIYNEIKRAFGNTVDAPKQASMFLLRAGIDGIRYPAGSLSGGGKGTNYVVFDENAVTVEDHILFQRSPEHEAEVQRAVEMGLPVPSNVLREYSDKEWATEELSRREAVLQKLTDFNWLARDARDYDNAQEFIEYVQSDFFEFTAKEDHPELYGENEQVSNQWLEEFWKDVQEQNAFMETTLEEGNKRWLSQVDDNYIKEVVRQIAEQYVGQKGKSLSIHGKFYAAAAKIKNGKGFEQKDIDTMKKVIENNPTRYREVLSILLDDQEEWQRLRVQEYGDLAAGTQTPEEKIQPKSRIDLAKEIEQLNKEKVQSGSYTAGEVDDLYTQVSKQLKSADRKINKLERELKEEKGASTVQIEKGRQKNEELKGEINNLEKEIKKKDREIKKLGDKNEKAKARLKKVREEKNEKLKQLKKEYSQKVKEAKKEGTRKKNEAVKKERAYQKELQRKKREAKQLREYKEKLARVIRRPVPKSVHWEYREMIESIQAGIDPHFRSKRTRLVWDKRREYFARNPEMLNELSPDFAKKLWKQSLDEFKLYELEEVAEQINHLTQLGKTKLRIIREQRQYEAQKAAQSIASKLLSGEPPAKPEPIVEEKEGVGEKGQALYLSTIRPSRLADMVDGGADFKGLAHKIFIDDVNEAYAESLRQRYAREEKIKSRMETLGITFNDLAEEVVIDGLTLTKDQIMDIAAAYQNRLKWRAVIHGNNIPVQTALRAINSLSKEELQFVDEIIGDYEENYNRLRKAHLDYTNEDMGSEENYTPMIRTEQDYTTHKEQIAQEILVRKGLRQGTPERGMTKHRIEIANRHQRPIKLGLYETWSAQVPRQEHYIASAEQILKMNRIMRNDYFKAAVDQQIGRPMYKELQSYIDRFANPNIYKSFGTWDKAIKKVRNNVALAYLAFNMMTMIKQVPSLAFYMAEAGPGDLLAGFSKATTNWKETRKFIEERDPQMRERAIERDMEELKRMKAKGYQKIQKAIGDTGMKGILFFDKLATTSGWIATYDKYKRKGYSEAEAVKAARDVTLRTQPQASAKDIASLWAQDGPLTLFTQFSNQLNQIWNMATYDMPAAIRQKNWEKALGMTTGMVLSATVIWMLSNRRPPEDLEDWAEVMAEQGLNMIPILGPVAARAMDGWTTEVSVFTPAQGVGELAGLMKKLAAGEDVSEYTIDSTVRSALEGLAIATGMPFVTPDRAVRGLGEDAVVQYILFGGELKGSKEE